MKFTNTMQEELDKDRPEIPETKWFQVLSRKVLNNQQRQQGVIESAFDGDTSIDIASIIRKPFSAKGNESLKNFLDTGDDKPRIVILANGIIHPVFDWVQASTFLEKKGMEYLRNATNTRGRCIEALNDTIQGDTIEGYTIKTIRDIQEKFFSGENCTVIIVRNASEQDLQDAVQYGGNNAVVLVGGHGTLGSVSMTNGRVKNEDIPTPREPIRAFIQHTCAPRKKWTREKMGERWSQEIYGWERGTSPIDFIDNPLNPRK